MGGFVIYNPSFRIVGIFDVTVGRLTHRLARIPLDLVADTPFLADIAGVPLIEQVADRRQLVLALGGVYGVRYRHQANVMLREKFLGQSADLDVVTAQAGKVFDKYRGGPSLFKLPDHLHKTRAVHRDARDTVIQEMDQVGVALLFRHFGQQLFLESDLSRVFSPRYITLYQKAK